MPRSRSPDCVVPAHACVPVCLRMCLRAYVPACPHARMRDACLRACVPGCLCVRVYTRVRARVPACARGACLRACLPACLHACVRVVRACVCACLRGSGELRPGRQRGRARRRDRHGRARPKGVLDPLPHHVEASVDLVVVQLAGAEAGVGHPERLAVSAEDRAMGGWPEHAQRSVAGSGLRRVRAGRPLPLEEPTSIPYLEASCGVLSFPAMQTMVDAFRCAHAPERICIACMSGKFCTPYEVSRYGCGDPSVSKCERGAWYPHHSRSPSWRRSSAHSSGSWCAGRGSRRSSKAAPCQTLGSPFHPGPAAASHRRPDAHPAPEMTSTPGKASATSPPACRARPWVLAPPLAAHPSSPGPPPSVLAPPAPHAPSCSECRTAASISSRASSTVAQVPGLKCAA